MRLSDHNRMEFSWWSKNEQGKFQMRAVFHGGNIGWERQNRRFDAWEPHQPDGNDWAKLLTDAERRVPRRLISPKQFAEIKRLAEQAQR
jgi:hypothetical protein